MILLPGGGLPMRNILPALTLLLASWPCLAKPPTHEVLPQVNALAVSYDVSSNDIRTVLYATNHEDITIICDAMMETDQQEKFRGEESSVAPGTTAQFAFKHRVSIDHVRLYLMCEPAPGEKRKAVDNDKTKSFQAGKMAEPAKPAEVTEENLDNF